MNKTNRLLLLGLVAQAVVITGMHMGSQDKMAVTSVKIFDPFDADKVTKIKILGAAPEKESDPPQNQVELTKEGTTWGIASADNYPADKAKVEDFLKALGKMRSQNTVLTKATFHKKLEVSPDKFQREITITQDGKDTKLYVGSSPSFKTVHVRLDGHDDVYLVSDFSTSDASDRSWGWVDRAYVNHPKKDVWSVKIDNAQGSIALERNPANDDWTAAGVTENLDTALVGNLVGKASSMNLEAPVGKSLKPEYGLDQPAATITLVTGTSTIAGTPPQSTEVTTIKIGKKLEKESQYYVKSSRSDYVVAVASWGIDPLLQKGPADLVKKETKPDTKGTPGAPPVGPGAATGAPMIRPMPGRMPPMPPGSAHQPAPGATAPHAAPAKPNRK